MGRGISVPISEGTLKWAIERSGFSVERLASELGVEEALLRSWLSGSTKPNLTQFKKLTGKLQRPAAIFFMEQPPADVLPHVSFRAPIDSERTSPNPVELRYLREASRIQTVTSWILGELGEPGLALPKISTNEDPEEAAQVIRQLLVAQDQPSSITANTTAWKVWRERLERLGVIVLALPLGKASSRGFSLWDRKAPLVAVNTAWNNEARLFSMLHEVGHLVTRTQSVCIESSDRGFAKSPDKVERWSERFSASVLMPWDEVDRFLDELIGIRRTAEIRDLAIAKKVANEFGASLRATVIRLIEHDLASWDLYREIPPISDQKRGGGGGKGRIRREKRLDEYGKQTVAIFSDAVDKGLMHRSEALSYLNIADSDFDEVQRSV